MNRRQLIAGFGIAASSAVAGCLSSSSPESETVDRTDEDDAGPESNRSDGSEDTDIPTPDGYVQPDGDPPEIPDALACEEEDFERLEQQSVEDRIVLGGSTDEHDFPFALRVDDQQYTYGDTVHITLRNMESEEQIIGNWMKFNLQLYTEAGWEEIRGTDAEGLVVLHTDEGLNILPGDEYNWTFELTEEGIDDLRDGPFTVCPTLQSGRYRFLFYDRDLAIEFDLVDA